MVTTHTKKPTEDIQRTNRKEPKENTKEQQQTEREEIKRIRKRQKRTLKITNKNLTNW